MKRTQQPRATSVLAVRQPITAALLLPAMALLAALLFIDLSAEAATEKPEPPGFERPEEALRARRAFIEWRLENLTEVEQLGGTQAQLIDDLRTLAEQEAAARVDGGTPR